MTRPYPLSAVCGAVLLFATLPAMRYCSAQASSQEDTPEMQAANAHDFGEYEDTLTVEQRLKLPVNAGKQSLIISHPVIRESHQGQDSAMVTSNYLSNQAVNSDVVVLGRPISVHSAFTADHAFAFSDYTLAIDQIVKDPSNSVAVGSTIVVAKGGGDLKLNGITIHAVDPAFPALVIGDRYVLFLHKLPNSAAFKVTANGSFHLSGGQADISRNLSTVTSKPEAEFMGDLHNAVSAAHVR